MNADEFELAANKTKLMEKKREAARLCLVDGLGYAEAARQVGLKQRQAANDAVKRVEREHKGIVGCPPGWECLTVCVPMGDAYFEIKEIEYTERKKAGLIVG